MDSPPEALLEYEKQRVQGRCISIVSEQSESSFDLVLQTSERRNELLNVLDLYLEWGKEEFEGIWENQRKISSTRFGRNRSDFVTTRISFIRVIHILMYNHYAHNSFLLQTVHINHSYRTSNYVMIA